MEDEVTLYLDLSKEHEEAEPWLKEKEEFIKERTRDCEENVISLTILSKGITIEDIAELSWLLDTNINICHRYFGSVKTIKSLWLEC